MSEFEFVLVLVSIILGLGMTDLLTVIARVLRREFSGGLVHGLWTLYVGGLLLQQFWSKWHATIVSDWSIYELTFFVLPSLVAFLAAALLAPNAVDGGSLDPYFIDRRRPFFAVLSLLMASYCFERWFLYGWSLTLDDAMSIPPIATYAFAALKKSRRTQITMALVNLGILVVFTLGWTETLSELVGAGS